MSPISEHDRNLLVSGWNATEVLDRREVCVNRFFEEQARERPSAIAIQSAHRQLSYAELDRRANQLAHHLRSRGVGPDVRVALCLERSPESIVTVLAILKAGGAYVPIDALYPPDRIAFMLRDASVAVVVTQASLRDRLGDHACFILVDRDAAAIAAEPAEPFESGATGESLAYVMYTSGSTGKPKGVEVVHRAINRLVRKVTYVRLGPDEVLLHAAPLAFDASTLEIWGALLLGGKIVLYPDAVPTASSLRDCIERFGVTTAWLTATLFNTVVDDDVRSLAALRQLLIGGEALSVPHVRRALEALPDTQIINGYGPTETTTFACCYPIPRPLPADVRSIPIGRPIRDTRVYVLDANRELVAIGEPGELYIGGDGLARGYLSRPELTAERFVPDPFRSGERLYRTGDVVRFLPDGSIDFVGRADTQVKIRGYRIELGEIESALNALPAVKTGVVIAREDIPGMKRLVAYLVARGERTRTPVLRETLAEKLPAFMVPSAFVWIDTVPLTPNGKLDARALPAPSSDRPDLSNAYVAPVTEAERALCGLWGDALGIVQVGATDNVFELGATSLLAVRVGARIRSELGWNVSPVAVFEHPTPRELAAASERTAPERTLAAKVARYSRQTSGVNDARVPIAIVGMAGRFPGAPSVEALWRMLREGREGISFFRDDEIDPAVPQATRADPSYVKARGVLDGVDLFDASFFGVPPKEAAVMDPQQRLMLELAWHALENAGHVPEAFDGRIGVFAGKYNDTYWSENVVTHPDLIQAVGPFQAMVANEKDYVATRIAHKLDLTGPALSIHTACSTSLVAIAQAVRSLRAGECDLALAGGIAITVPVRSGYMYQEGAMLSSDGHTRSFDEGARGTVFSDGAGFVVLRRLDEAERDGDTIYAVVRGVALNNDGAAKASFTAPSVDGQATVVAMALADGGVDARSVSYVEAHGTATPLGDPIEVEALTRAFRTTTSETGFCAIGSIKSNVGHTVIAAGVAGIIKTALALAREVIPPSLHYGAPNPKIDFANSPFFVNTELRPWPRADAPRRAGVSSFGVGGTNAHVVLEEAPSTPPLSGGRPQQVLLLSARTTTALDAATRDLAECLAAAPDTPLADVAFTLHNGRRHFRQRRAVVAGNARDAAQLLARAAQRPPARQAESQEPSVVFMFPGQGAQYVGMGRALYLDEPVFREHIDRCAEGLRGSLDRDLRDVLMPKPGDSELAAASLRETRFTQPALFAIGYSLAKLWQAWGVKPKAMVGHSIGEFVCAVLADVMSLEDALRLVGARGRLMFDQPPGDMLSIRTPAADLQASLGPDLAIASNNGPSLCVVAGPPAAVAKLRAELEAKGVVCKPLHTSHAFHSPMMDPVVEPFTRLVEQVPLSAPRVPFVSTLTGTWITPEQARDPKYWGRHLRDTVRFAEAAATLWNEPGALLLEVGPRGTLATLARQQATDRSRQVAVASLADSEETEWSALLNALGQLWCAGVKLDPPAFWAGDRRRRRLPLPTYPFERQRFWVDPAHQPSQSAANTASTPAVSTPAQENPTMSVGSQSRTTRLIADLRQIFEDASGIEVGDGDLDTNFLELGLDSLFLTQVAIAVQKKTDVKVNFRLLIEQTSTVRALADYLDAELPPDSTLGAPAPANAATSAPGPAPAAAAVAMAPAPVVAAPLAGVTAVPAFQGTVSPRPIQAATDTVQWVIEQQLQLMTKQLALLQGSPVTPTLAAPALQARPDLAAPSVAAMAMPAAVAAAPMLQNSEPPRSTPTSAPGAATAARPAQVAPALSEEAEVVKKPFGAIARISLNTDGLTPRQRARLESLTRRYTARTKASKQWTEEHRSMMADPRVVTGFRPAIKELIYPIVVERSAGARIWDLDGNEYVDTLMGFGCNMFGWQPEFVTKAIEEQLRSGHEIGPQTRLAGECAKLLCEFTGFDRAAFCNTGSEAVMGAMRIARTVTGRTTIALFTGSYHGIFDEVIVRGTKKLKAIPAAPGIMRSTSENVLVLDYGTPESLEILRSRANDLAAILVEPVQSRRPDFQPREYLQQLRELTSRSGTVLIFDEVITGFRTGPGGAQEHFGIQADLASYGKVIGGGLPIGVIAGKRAFMDALDGGHWQFGDTSVPTVGVTYFAGTFVRHPLALAAVKSVLLHLKEKGPALQRETTAKAARLATELNAFFKQVEAPLEIRHFASLWKAFHTEEHPSADLLFVMLRDRGIHIMDGFPCFFTTAHTEADVDTIVGAFKSAVAEMQESGFFPEPKTKTASTPVLDASQPPIAGARLGRDADGKPAWFVPNPKEPGRFLKVDPPS